MELSMAEYQMILNFCSGIQQSASESKKDVDQLTNKEIGDSAK